MRGKLLLGLLLIVMLAGCGGPKADVTIFMMGPQGVPNEVGDKLQQALQTKLGTAPTIQVVTTPMFSMEKMVVEIAAGENGILILPMDQFKTLGNQGGYIALDDVTRADDYPDGVLELKEEGKPSQGKHLYGIPLEKTKWFTDLKLNGKDLVAFIPANAPDKEKSKQVMKRIAEKSQ
ncbi:hypothetical protein O9H85_29115 [Paenibacillus filicis]|uniref:Lipoprotein n=1 Tax=Paenibacillus gyeongsangnamensis TaxID=3388067 RepID=A0ABT4QI33_9BACL|nr:hypothetical protein [Paenibacillus filicis]MCZ8516381.1 hypothetical protein [Paenibacillus filicis]